MLIDVSMSDLYNKSTIYTWGNVVHIWVKIFIVHYIFNVPNPSALLKSERVIVV